MATCPGIEDIEAEIAGVPGIKFVHCHGCRDAAPPVLTPFERGQLRSVRDAYTRGESAMSDVKILLAVIDRLTHGGTGGSPRG